MAYFEWNSRMAVGHVQIDAQHKHMFALAEGIFESLAGMEARQLSDASMQAFIDFARMHFEYEEALMRSCAYPEAEEHAKFHASLLSELDGYRKGLSNGANADPAGLASAFSDWIIQHIELADHQLIAWLALR